MSRKKWRFQPFDKELAAQISEDFNMDPFLALLLVTRGLENYADIDEFLSGELDFSDPCEIVDMDAAAARVLTAVEGGEKICVYGDFDADGVSATALLYLFLKRQGANVMCYIPNREGEGYGLNCDAVKELASKNVDLIITVDNGISALEEADYIYELGMQLVVTDHHQPGEKLPRAEAVVDPHRKDAGLLFSDWAGVGVAFKLACALYDGDYEELFEEYGILAAIGTIGDIVPLTGENRMIVKRGMELINRGANAAIEAFREVAGCGDKILSAVDVAFTVVPRINAAGRICDPMKALELLTCEDEMQVRVLAGELNACNLERQSLEKEIMEDIAKQIEMHPDYFRERVIVVDGEGYHQGVVGIVASRLVDRFGKPCIVISREASCGRGSCRSIEGFSIYDALESCKTLLLRFGGHPLAAGLSISAENIGAFREAVNAYAARSFPVMPVRTLDIDCKLSPAYINLDLLESISALEPFGAENLQPVFALMQMHLSGVTPVGDGKHLRLSVEKAGRSYAVMLFGVTPAQFRYKTGDMVDLAVKLSKNLYNGRECVSIQCADIRLSGGNDERYILEKACYDRFERKEVLTGAELESLLPPREVCARIYRFLSAGSGFDYGYENLYFRLQKSDITYGQMMVGLTAFSELGLIRAQGEKLTIVKAAGKMDLDSAPILKDLRRRVENGNS